MAGTPEGIAKARTAQAAKRAQQRQQQQAFDVLPPVPPLLPVLPAVAQAEQALTSESIVAVGVVSSILRGTVKATAQTRLQAAQYVIDSAGIGPKRAQRGDGEGELAAAVERISRAFDLGRKRRDAVTIEAEPSPKPAE